MRREHHGHELPSCRHRANLAAPSANAIAHLSDITFTGGTFSNTLPAQKHHTVYVAGRNSRTCAQDEHPANAFSFWLDGQSVNATPPVGQRLGELDSGPNQSAREQFASNRIAGHKHTSLLSRRSGLP